MLFFTMTVQGVGKTLLFTREYKSLAIYQILKTSPLELSAVTFSQKRIIQLLFKITRDYDLFPSMLNFLENGHH